MKHIIRSLLVLLCLVNASGAQAHASSFAVLTVSQQPAVAPYHYAVQYALTAPAISAYALPVFPPDCRQSTVKRKQQTATAINVSWSINCKHSLLGRSITLDQASTPVQQLLYEFHGNEGTAETVYTDRPTAVTINSEVIPDNSEQRSAATQTLWGFMAMGFEHMLLGWDHMLFVLLLWGLFGASRPLLIAITGFTLGHSITLLLACQKIITLPGPPVEALIALSIIYLSVETLQKHNGRSTALSHYPLSVTLGFGLLHGLGFSGAIAEVNIPPALQLSAVLFFNLGIELAQLLVIAFMTCTKQFVQLRVVQKHAARNHNVGATLRVPLLYSAGIISGFWFSQRVAGF